MVLNWQSRAPETEAHMTKPNTGLWKRLDFKQQLKSTLALTTFLAVSFCSLSGAFAAPVWEIKKSWNDESERDFAIWIKRSVKADYFSDKFKFLERQVAVDCAKAAYALRAIFAYENGLPFKVRPLKGDFIDAENPTNSVNSIRDPKARFIQFLKTVVVNTSSFTLKDNTFPIEITKQNVLPGIVYVFQMPGEESEVAGRHVYIVKDLFPAGLIQFTWATVPAKPRMLAERIQFPFYMPLTPTVENQWGFRRFYQPQDYEQIEPLKNALRKQSKPEEIARIHNEIGRILGGRGYHPYDQVNMARQVMDQYNTNVAKYLERTKQPKKSIAQPVKSGTFISDPVDGPAELNILPIYHQALVDRLAKGSPEKMEEKLHRDLFNVCSYIKERVEAVDEGYQYFFNEARIVSKPNTFNRCPTQDDIYNYTTPNRDSELRSFISGTKAWYLRHKAEIQKKYPDSWYLVNELLYNRAQDFGPYTSVIRTPIAKAKNALEKLALQGGFECDIKAQIYDEKRVPETRFLYIWHLMWSMEEEDLASSEPWVSIERRWGMKRVSKAERAAEKKFTCQESPSAAAAASEE